MKPGSDKKPGLSRGEFLRLGARGVGALAVLSAMPAKTLAQTNAPAAPAKSAPEIFDLREFADWIVKDFAPTVKLPGGAGNYARSPGETATELYGVADMACILYTLGALHPDEKERAEWAAAFQAFQNPDTGWLVEKSPTHDPLHNTAFALAAMQLLDLTPQHPVKMGAEYSDPGAFLNTLDWKTKVYTESHKGAGVGSIFTLVPSLGTPEWFEKYFAACDALFDPNNGLMGKEKPPGGDSDQIGGSFHYSFLYQNFNRHMPFPEPRIDSVLRLQLPDGYWMTTNHLWMTLDAVFLMTRTLRYCPHRFDDVCAVVRRVMGILMRDIFSAEGRKQTFTGRLAVHSVTAAISIAAEAQQFLGAKEIVTERPLKLVLDRRPFI